MRVLTAVFSDAGGIALDIAGVGCRLVEGWRKQEHQTFVASHQIFFNRCHCALGACTFAGAGNDAPGLRDRIDTAFIVHDGTERSPIIEVSATVPVAVPSLFERGLELGRMLAPLIG